MVYRRCPCTDGLRFTTLPSPGPNVTVREGPDGRLWALLPVPNGLQGIQTLDGELWATTPLPDVQPFAAGSRDFLPWAADRVLILTPDRILEYEQASGSVRELLSADGTGIGRFLGCGNRAAGGAWVVGAKGVAQLDAGGAVPRTWRAPAWASGALRAALTEGRDGSLWLVLGLDGGRQVVAQTDGTRWTRLAEGQEARGNWVAAWPGADDDWWLATAHYPTFDLKVTSGGEQRVLPPARMLSGQLLAVTAASDGGVWLATAQGVVRHTPAAWRAPSADLQMSQPTGPLLQTSRGDLIAAQVSRLMHSIDGSHWHGHEYPRPLGLGAVHHSGILVERGGGTEVAFSTTEGLMRLDGETDVLTLTPLAIAGAVSFSTLGKARDGGVWLLVNPGGLRTWIQSHGGQTPSRRIEGDTVWRTIYPREIVETDAGDVYVIPDGTGVARWRDGRLDHIGAREGYPGNGAFCGAQVAPGRVWFGDRDAVIELEGGNWRVVRDGLQTVRAVVPARDGSVWVTSGTGLHHYRDGSWLTVTEADGLPDGAMVDVIEDCNGGIWASGIAGLTRHHPEADLDPPDTRLDGANPREVPPSGHVQFVFSGADPGSTTSSNRLLFSWRADGGVWTPFAPVSVARLQALTTGAHTFEVRAMDRNGNVDPSPATFAFEVLRPWFLATGFLLVGLPGLLLLGTGAGLVVTRHLRLGRLVEERTAALQQAHKQVLKEVDERQQAEARFRQAQKMEALGRLAGGVAHDFNNLLTVISGYAELLGADPAATDQSRDALGEIAKAAGRATALTRQLLAFGRHQVSRLEAIDLNAVVRDVSKMLARLLGEDVTLEFEATPDLWTVAADRGQMEQVLINLAVNARDAMPRGGRVAITLQNAMLDDEFCRGHEGMSPGAYVRVGVADEGAGIDVSMLDRIFEPFFTTKASGKGTGLGLSPCVRHRPAVRGRRGGAQ